MKTYFKTIGRSVKRNIAKFVSITVIMLLGIAFVAGLGTLSPTIKDSFNKQLNADDIPDIIVKSKSARGFTQSEIGEFSALDFVSCYLSLTAADIDDGGKETRIYVCDDFSAGINRLKIEGELPKATGEILVERAGNETEPHAIGDEITLYGMTFKVVGIASNPLLFDRYGEPSMMDADVTLERIIYFKREFCPLPLPVTDLYLRLDLNERDFFDRNYLAEIDRRITGLKERFGDDGYAYLTIKENKSYNILDSYCEKINIITLIFPVFFIAVAALTVMTTITRMAEEERPETACLKSLGAGDGRIIFKYLFLTGICCIIAVLLGLLVGLTVLPKIIYPAFNTLFFMPPSTGRLYPLGGLIAFAAMTAAVLGVTAAVCKGRLRETPAQLMTAKAPKPGKRILLEKIGFIWKRLSFKYKSSIRNIFRYKKHLLMTVISVAGSTALTFAGFSLLNVANAVGQSSFAGMKDSLGVISAVVIAFALLLCVFVIYNLTNLNIGERQKEIATLDVLGYRSKEILGYIYREIAMTAVFGAFLGIALGCGLVQFVLTFLDFGSLADVKWYSYLLSFALIMVFIGFTDLLLMRKILKVDMATSLKSNE